MEQEQWVQLPLPKPPFKVIVAGSRSITDGGVVLRAILESGWANDITEIVSGTARGVDTLGEEFAQYEDLRVQRFPADWDKHGRSAGYRRNQQMADYADALIAIWDGKSRGTKHMIDIATKKGLQIFVHIVDS